MLDGKRLSGIPRAFFCCAVWRMLSSCSTKICGLIPFYNGRFFAFSGCSKLERVKIPGSIAILEEGAFQACSSLSEVQLEEGLLIIREKAYLRKNLTRSVAFSLFSQAFLQLQLAFLLSFAIRVCNKNLRVFPFSHNTSVQWRTI